MQKSNELCTPSTLSGSLYRVCWRPHVAWVNSRFGQPSALTENKSAESASLQDQRSPDIWMQPLLKHVEWRCLGNGEGHAGTCVWYHLLKEEVYVEDKSHLCCNWSCTINQISIMNQAFPQSKIDTDYWRLNCALPLKLFRNEVLLYLIYVRECIMFSLCILQLKQMFKQHYSA